jgi:MFS family permease
VSLASLSRVGISLFLTLLDSSIVATSLYTIGVEFEAAETVNWVALSYTLAYLSCAVTFSRLSDVVGRRNTFLAGQVIFVAFSLACGFSHNLHQLIIFRTLQGIGGSGQLTSSLPTRSLIHVADGHWAGIYSLSMVILPELCPPHLEQYIGSLIGSCIGGDPHSLRRLALDLLDKVS